MKSAWAIGVLSLAGTFAAIVPSFAGVVSVGSQTVAQGGFTTVDLGISGLGNGTALGGFDLNVGFDPSLLSFSSAAFGDPTLGDQLDLEGFGTITDTVAGSGTTELYELSLDSPSALISLQPSSFTLGTLTFVGLRAGKSPLSISFNTLADQNGNSLSAMAADGTITVTPAGAPQLDEGPAPVGLTLALGCVAVLSARWRRRGNTTF